MAGLSLKVLLELQKKGFDRNIASVKSGLNSLKKTVMGITSAFVGGLGLNQLIGHFKQTATELSQVEATLKNVSDSYLDYADNLEFLQSVAHQYGQEQNALVGSFAKFSSAAKGAGMEMAQQQRIFRSLTKAAGAFHLSADQTASVMLAVEQMISKGVVASEELRRQLSNVLPGSFQAMANAAKEAGIIATNSQQALMDAMKQGKVVASDVLPYFAKELDKITANADFNSLVSSVNRLSNAWIKFVKSSQFTTFYQKMVDGLANALDSLGSHFKTLMQTIVQLGTSIAAAFAVGKFTKLATKNIADVKLSMQDFYSKAAEASNKVATLRQQLLSIKAPGFTSLAVDLKTAEVRAMNLGSRLTMLADDAARQGKDTVKAFLNQAEASKYLTYQIKEQRKIAGEFEDAARRSERTFVRSTTTMGKAAAGLRGILNGLKAIWSSIWQLAVISAVFFAIEKIVGAIKNAVSEAKRLKAIEQDTVKNAQTLNEEAQSEIDKVKAELALYEREELSVRTRQKALNEINNILGRTSDNMFQMGDSAKEIGKAIKDWEKIKSAETISKQMDDALEKTEVEVSRLERRLVEIQNDVDYNRKMTVTSGVQTYETLTKRAMELAREEKKITKELNAQKKARENLLNAGAGGSEPLGPPAPPGLGKSGSGGYNEDQTAVKNALDEYQKKVNDLTNKKKNGILTSQQFQKELSNEQYKTLQDIGAIKNLEQVVNSLGGTYQDTFKAIRKGARSASSGGSSVSDPLREAFDKYSTEKKKLDNLFNNGFIDLTQYHEKQLELVEDLEQVVGSFEDIRGAVGALGGSYLQLWEAVEEGKVPLKMLVDALHEKQEAMEKDNEATQEAIEKQKEFDKAMADAVRNERPHQFDTKKNDMFDYKKSDAEKKSDFADQLEEYADKWQNYVNVLESVQEKYGDLGDAAQQALKDAGAELERAIAAAKSARDAANLAQILEDMEDLKKELRKGYWNEFTSITDGFYSITSSIENCIGAFERLDEKDATFFDGIKAGFSVLDILLTTMESVNNALMAYKTVQELVSKSIEMNKKKEAAASALAASAAQTEAIAKTDGAVESVAASAAQAAASEAAANASAKEAVAGAASSVAKKPFLGPLLAAAAIATVLGALLPAMQKFANGGIVGGSSRNGDNNLVRANSGEMLLNRAQQANLFNMINKGTGGGKVEFEIRGDRLVGAINNYNSKRRG